MRRRAHAAYEVGRRRRGDAARRPACLSLLRTRRRLAGAALEKVVQIIDSCKRWLCRLLRRRPALPEDVVAAK